MKRIIALALTILLLAVLFPASIVSNAESVKVSPYYVVNWGGVADDVYEHMYGLPYTWISKNDITPTTTQINPTLFSSSDVKVSAQNLKEMFDARPEGTRYINLVFTRTVLTTTAKAQIDLTHGVGLAKDYLTRLFSEYARIGGKLDGISLDLEYFGGEYWTLHQLYNNGRGPNPNVYNEIVANEVYKNKFRPMLAAKGFPFYNGSNHPEIWNINPNAGSKHSTAATIWNDAWGELLAEYQYDGIVEPIMTYFPDIIISDYKVGDVFRWQRGMNGDSGTQATGHKVGNTSNENAYNARPGMYFFGYGRTKENGWDKLDKTTRKTYVKPASYNGAVYPDSAYGNALWDVNAHKRMLEATDTRLLNSWIAFPSYNSQNGGYANTPYYSETILHIGLMTTGTFFGYVVPEEVASGNFTDNPELGDYDYNLSIIDDLMAELTRVAGVSDRKPIVMPVNWNDGYMLTGAYAGGRNIWRITPDTSKITGDFKVKDKAPTFSIAGQTITFPQGRIIKTGKILDMGNCGYWVETPANVMPVVTNDEDRYSKDPSFLEDFDSYANGTFTADSVKPDTFWNISGSVGIVNKNNSKVMGMSGDATVTNTKVPEKITAGDSFAQQQVWEVSVMLPSGNYGTLKLLSFGGEDGGIKISNGKVYYDNAGSYQELSGVSLSAGTYTVKRKLDFKNNKASYAVYDASGNQLGSTEAVSLASVSLPVTTISMSTTGTKEAVYIDNYKLYPAGVTAELLLYDAANGLALTDNSATRTQDTAYRLSWMNATGQYKVAKVYNGSTLVQTVEMQPGTDGVAVAVVKATASNPAKLSVKVEDSNAPSHPDYDNGDFKWTAHAYSLGLAGGPAAESNNGGVGNGNTGSVGGNNNTGSEGDEGGAVDGTDGNTDGNTGEANGGNNDSIKPNGNNNKKPGSNQNSGAASSEKRSLGAGAIALIAVVGVVILTAGLTVAFWFAVMPKLTDESPAWLLGLAKGMRAAAEKIKTLFKKESIDG